MAAALRTDLEDRVLLVGASLPARAVTAAWAAASVRPGSVVVGTRDVALWNVADLSLAVIVGDGRRAMKSPQSPTLHVRDVLRRRAAVERFPLVVAGSVPTIETLSGGAAIEQIPGRAWRLIEVVDRREDRDPGALITDRVRTATRTVAGRGGRVFCLVHRRGYAPAFRCVACGRVRRCESCGAAVDRDGSCRRCGATAGACPHCGGTRFAPLGAGVGRVVDDLARSLGDSVGTPDTGKPVIVGTERDLVGIPPLDLAVLIDTDAWLLAPHYRAEEDTLRLLARLAGRVAPGSGKRAMVQTALADHRVLAAARSGRAIDLLLEIGAERASSGFPPAGQLLALDARGAPATADGDLRAIVGDDADVLGPGEAGDDLRWLIQAHRLDDVRIRLRGLIQQWRDAGIRVRVDADPVDL
jgi:primosomal protein N'